MSVETGFPNPHLGRINKQVFKTQILPEAMKDEVAEVREFTQKGVKEFVNSEWRQKNEQFLGGKEGIGRLQTALQEKGYYKGLVDNDFGPATLVALLNFQLKNGLDTDGIAGSLTQEKLGLKEDAKGVLDTLGGIDAQSRFQDRFDDAIAPHTLANLRSYFGLPRSQEPLDSQLIAKIQDFQQRYNDGHMTLLGRKPDTPLRTDGFPDKRTVKIVLMLNSMRYMRF